MCEPPLGIMPRHIWIKERLDELESAIQRYIEADKSVPIEWIMEYNELVLSKSVGWDLV